jgi:hypothetical protein
MERSANLSTCGAYRFTLTRVWDAERRRVLVVMANPSKADHEVEDPTSSLLISILDHNGFGAYTAVNLCPLRSSKPADALSFMRALDGNARLAVDRDALHHNLDVVDSELLKLKQTDAVLLAWGSIASGFGTLVLSMVSNLNEFSKAMQVPLYCLGKTASGHPKHPMARGTHKVPKDAPLIPWRTP